MPFLDVGNVIGPKGPPGKSAYEYAVDGGYTGTEEEFYTDVSRTPKANAVYQLVLEDRTTSEKWMLDVKNGVLQLLGVDEAVGGSDIQLIDGETGTGYRLIVENGVLGIEALAQ